MWPELYGQIHPEKAAELGVRDGDRIHVETASGQIEVRAWDHRGIRPSAMFVPIGWDEQQLFHPAASVSHLTAVSLDPISQQANLKVHLCRVCKVED
jgi:anaerobic selenocysteine-containing dehydrogenase